MLNPSWQIGNLKDFLFLLDFECHMRCHGIHQTRGVINAGQG